MRTFSKISRRLVLVGLLLGLGACGMAERPVSGDHPARSGAHRQAADIPPQPVEHDGPCVGDRLDISKPVIDLMIGTPVLLPHSSLASRANLASLWRCAGGAYHAVFANGVDVSVEPGWNGVDNSTRWSGYIKSNGYGELATVHGLPGMVQEPEGDYRGLAQVVIGGWLVIVAGNSTLPAKDLVGIANTL